MLIKDLLIFYLLMFSLYCYQYYWKWHRSTCYFHYYCYYYFDHDIVNHNKISWLTHMMIFLSSCVQKLGYNCKRSRLLDTPVSESQVLKQKLQVENFSFSTFNNFFWDVGYASCSYWFVFMIWPNLLDYLIPLYIFI